MRDYRRGNTHVTTERDLLRVNGAEIGFLLSFGTAVNYLRAYYALEQQGPWPAAKLLGRLIASAVAGTHLSRAVFQAIEADIECDGEPLPFRLFTFFFAAHHRAHRARLPADVPRQSQARLLPRHRRPDRRRAA